MSGPEITFAEIDNDYSHTYIKEALREEGGIVIRTAIAPQRCDFYRLLIDKTYDYLIEQCAKEGHPVDETTEADKNDQAWQGLAYNLQNGQLPPGFFEKANLGFSIFDLIGNFRFHRIMSKFFDGDFRSSPSAHVRRISPSSEQQREQWQGPTPWHIDGQYHNPRHFGLNFWVPLNTCGIEAPGLRIIRANVFDMQRYVEYDPVEETFNAGRLKTINETVFDDFEEGQIFAPELKVGDVFLFHNWTIHQTNCQDGMTKPRKSCELRVIQDAWTFPEGGSC